MRQELLLGTAAAPKHMTISPPGTAFVIGTIRRVSPIKKKELATFSGLKG
jgi:hypothetical protein